jgi:cholesterol transport system auxiliary component
VSPIAKTLAAGLAALSLTGCVSLFPKSEPAQLYRFGATMTAAQPGQPGPVPLLISPPDFNASAAGDRILTVTGTEVAYIAAARWANPAKVLFTESLEQAFERNARVVAPIERREMRTAAVMLEVDVNAFEARYLSGQGAAPTAVVSLDARLVKLPERTVIAQRSFEASQAASENRVSAIVQALDSANGQVLDQLVQWADASAR